MGIASRWTAVTLCSLVGAVLGASPAVAHTSVGHTALQVQVQLADLRVFGTAPGRDPSPIAGIPQVASNGDLLLLAADWRNWRVKATHARAVDVSKATIIDLKLQYRFAPGDEPDWDVGFLAFVQSEPVTALTSPSEFGYSQSGMLFRPPFGAGARAAERQQCVTALQNGQLAGCLTPARSVLGTHSLHLTLTRTAGDTHGTIGYHWDDDPFVAGGAGVKWPTAPVLGYVIASSGSAGAELLLQKFQLSIDVPTSSGSSSSNSTAYAATSPEVSEKYKKLIARMKKEANSVCLWWEKNSTKASAKRECDKWVKIVAQVVEEARADAYLSRGMTVPWWSGPGCSYVRSHVRGGHSVRGHVRC